jgi:gas vesicle protein
VGKDPDQIRQEIAETRAEMGETVEALGYKADVKTRVKESVAEKKDAVVSRVSGAVPDTQGVKRGARRGVGIAKENPIGLAIGGLALGFLVGLAVPSTRVEDERLGEMGDQLRDTARETGHEALERGKTVAQEAASSAAETARETGSREADDMASTLKESAQQVASSPGGSSSAA